jgi:hypothetical protein
MEGRYYRIKKKLVSKPPRPPQARRTKSKREITEEEQRLDRVNVRTRLKHRKDRFWIEDTRISARCFLFILICIFLPVYFAAWKLVYLSFSKE